MCRVCFAFELEFLGVCQLCFAWCCLSLALGWFAGRAGRKMNCECLEVISVNFRTRTRTIGQIVKRKNHSFQLLEGNPSITWQYFHRLEAFHLLEFGYNLHCKGNFQQGSIVWLIIIIFKLRQWSFSMYLCLSVSLSKKLFHLEKYFWESDFDLYIVVRLCERNPNTFLYPNP